MMHGNVGRGLAPPRWEGVAEGGEIKMRMKMKGNIRSDENDD